jgi:hypothetical protein
MQVEKRTLNWFPRESSYDYVRGQQLKRREHADDFIAKQQAAADAFAGITSTDTTSQGDLVAQAAAARLNVKI